MKRWILALAAASTLAGATVAATAATAPRVEEEPPSLGAIEASIEAQIDERLREVLADLRAGR